MENLAGITQGFEFSTTVVAQAKFHRVPLNRPSDDLTVMLKLISDGSSNEIAPVRVETFLHQKINSS